MTKILKNDLENLFLIYKDRLNDVNLEIFSDACQFIEDYKENDINWSELSFAEANTNLEHLLKKSFVVNENQAPIFSEVACRTALFSKEQEFNDANNLYLARDIESTGIQEKYLKSQLGSNEPLTELDTKRFILATGMAGTIQVTDLSSEQIGLALRNQKPEGSNEPYSVAMMVNASNKTAGEHPQWLSVVVTINPLSNYISYKISSEDTISPEQEKVIKDAINGEKNAYAAFPEAPKVSGNIQQIQPDTAKSSGGYKVLHRLYQDDLESKIIDNPQAKNFAEIEPNSKAILNAVYEVELRAIKLDPEQEAILSEQAASNFQNGLIKEEAVVRQISSLGAAIPAVTSQHNLVTEKISELQFYHNKVNFPGEIPAIPLSSVDYQHFLLLVNEKFRASGTNKILDELVMPCDVSALKGLIAYNETNLLLPFKSLTLDLNGVDLKNEQVREHILFNLKSTLLSMSVNHLNELKLTDPDNQLDKAMIKELANFIQSRHIAIDITLPANFQASTEQRQIDEAVSDSIRERTIRELGKKIAKTDEHQPIAKELRARPKLPGKQNLSIDIELQQEQQVEVAVEAGIEKSSGGSEVEESDAEVYDLFKFQNALRYGLFANRSKSYLVNEAKAGESDKLWRTWLGFLTNHEANQWNSLKLSKTACEELLRYKDKFQYGLDLKELPPGFTLRTEGSTSLIHFDENLKLLAAYNPLQIQTTSIPEPVPLTNNQFNTWVESTADDHPIKMAWDKVNKSNYDKNAHRIFKQYLPQMLLLDRPQQELLSSICFNPEGNFEKKRLEFLLTNATELKPILADSISNSIIKKTIKKLFADKREDVKSFIRNYQESHPDFEHHLLNQLVTNDDVKKAKITSLIAKVPGINLDGLLQIYIQSGEKGIDSLSRIVDEDVALFTQLNTYVFAKSTSYMPALNEEHQDAFKAIKGFSDNERIWWNTLLQQHCEAQSDVNLVDLVNAFKQFKEELGKLSAKDDQPLRIPDECLLKGVTSLPVALSRMLTLLKHTNQENRLDQWKVLSSLDFSSTGVAKLTTATGDKLWAFITPEMNINARHELENPNQSRATHYTAPRNWKSIGAEPEKVVEHFFRFAAYQAKNGQLPLEFYRYAHESIAKSGLSPRAQEYMYGLIASATTDVRNSNAIKSVDEAKKDCDNLIKLIKNPPLPSILPDSLKEQARINLLSTLQRLDDQPPLPVLNRLVSLISSSLDSINPVTIMNNVKRLNETNASLKQFVNTYGPCVYEGMKDYSASDYKEGELFFFHMSVLKTINERFTSKDIQAKTSLIRLISTFRIKEADLDRIISTQFGNDVKGIAKDRRDEAMSYILQHVSTEGKTKLNADDLIHILNEVRKPSEQSVLDVIKEIDLPHDGLKLRNYIPENILETYGKEGVPPKVTQLIADNFNEQQQAQIEKILLRFNGPNDNAQYIEVVKKLILITKPPLPKLEKNIFIAKMCSSMGLYSDIKPLDDEKNPFIKLLDAVIANNSPDDLINFIAAERALLRASNPEQIDEFFIRPNPTDPVISNLAEKALLYISNVLPGIRDLGEINISQVDLTPRILEIILKTPNEQLEASSSIVTDEEAEFVQLDQRLVGVLAKLNDKGKINFKALIKSNDSFLENSGLKETESFKKYGDYLKQISQPKISKKDGVGIAKNPALLLIILYISNPDAMPQAQRRLFEERYKSKIESLVTKYPGIMLNKDSLDLIVNNTEFINALAEKNVVQAAQSHDLLEEDAKLDLVFAALEKDLNGVNEFNQNTQDLQSELHKQKDALHTYPKVFNNLFKKINQIAGDNLNSKKQFLELFDTYLQHYSPEKHGELIKYLTEFVTSLEQVFTKTADKTIILSLCLQFNNDKHAELTPEKLLDLMKYVDGVPQEDQSTVLKIAVALINNEKGYNLEDFKELCKIVNKEPEFAKALETIYKKAPFPAIVQVVQWNKGAKETSKNANTDDYAKKMYANSMAGLYERYSTAPCHREGINGFHVEKAISQLAKFKINGKEPGPEELKESKVYFEKFRQVTLEMRGKTRDELVELFNGFKGKKPEEVDNDLLVAVAAELLHRSKGKDDTEVDGSFKLGSSFEINTTQYMAILTMIKTPGHVTSEIGTGEGKSRIMMISLACQNALGKTVDFITSDAQLATRDFVEFQAYFEVLGAKTSMIFANSDPSEYKNGGINFSDPSNLSLFRNKARSMGRGDEVIDDDPANRAAMIDEADKTYFDVADTRFNFSKEGDENIRGMEWVYPLLMEYFAQQEVTLADGKTKSSPLDLYYNDVDQSREKFLQFASGNCTSAQLIRLKALSYAQIEQWQVSAVTANHLKFKEDFTIEPDLLISTSSGPKISSEAQLLFANRVSKSSKFSFGVHQCLHARLNIARQNLSSVKDANLKDALQQCEQSFYVPDEKQIVYSSTSKNLLDDYQEGTLKAVTGTAGSMLEREEASASGTMQFIDVPRDKGLNRWDKAIRLTTNQKQQIESLVDQIKEARAKNQPILIIAENDEESAFLFKRLNQVFKDDIQHVHSQLSSEDEKARVDIAGKPGQITVSTDMIGRGTDISLKGAAKTNGLNVMLTYLPRVRDLEQIIGRSGRFGANGETSLTLDKQRLKKSLGRSALGSDYYRNVEAYIEREQAIMDRNKQCERLIKNTVGDFRKDITTNFFNDMLKQVNKSDYKKLMPAWTSFFDKSDKAWNEVWPHIQAELSKEKVDTAAVEELLTEYQDNAQKMWNALRRNTQDIDVVCRDGTKPIDKLNEDLSGLKLSESTKKLITGFDISQYSLDKVKIYDKYDPGHDGRAVTYKHWYIPVIASIKGYLNILPGVNFSDARKPFANFRAWIEGRGQIFPNTRAFIANAVDAVASIFSKKEAAVQNAVSQEDKLENDVPVKAQKAPTYNGAYQHMFATGVAHKDKIIFEAEDEDKQVKQPVERIKRLEQPDMKNEAEFAIEESEHLSTRVGLK